MWSSYGGPITSNQVTTHRPSYINAILIQSHGNVVLNCVWDHVLVFARSRSVIVSQSTSRGVATIVNGATMRPNAPYGTTELWSCVCARECAAGRSCGSVSSPARIIDSHAELASFGSMERETRGSQRRNTYSSQRRVAPLYRLLVLGSSVSWT